MTDFILFVDYIEGSIEIRDNFVEDQTSELFGNATAMTCSSLNSTSDGQFVCVRYNYWFAILTLLFIYAPSVNVAATLNGPRTAGGALAGAEGLALEVLGGILLITGVHVPSLGAAMAGWFMMCLGAGVVGLGAVNWAAGQDHTDNKKWHKHQWVFFLPLLICSPGIFIFIKLLAIMKHDNQLIQCQATYGSRGEAILEAAPQLGLQLYIILLSMSPKENQLLSVITSYQQQLSVFPVLRITFLQEVENLA